MNHVLTTKVESAILPAMGRQRVLVVDDESSITRMLKLVLERALPVDVFPFAAALEALDWIDGGATVDLVICDLRMPGMDGLAFCRALRERRFPAPVVILSAYASSDMDEATQDLGVNAFVQKPFMPKAFVEQVRDLLPAAADD